ncbi:MAG: hypothetical protein WCP34_10020 [Pseudomonadota bacterium]
MTSATHLDQHCINSLRFLSVDMVRKANSGYPSSYRALCSRFKVRLCDTYSMICPAC